MYTFKVMIAGKGMIAGKKKKKAKKWTKVQFSLFFFFFNQYLIT